MKNFKKRRILLEIGYHSIPKQDTTQVVYVAEYDQERAETETNNNVQAIQQSMRKCHPVASWDLYPEKIAAETME